MKRILYLILIDSLAFITALMLTYFVFASFKVTFISFLLVKTYLSLIVLLWLMLIIVANFLGLYNAKKPIYSSLRVLATSFIYFIVLILISYIYPKYSLSRVLFLIDFLFIYLFLNSYRLFLAKFLRKA